MGGSPVCVRQRNGKVTPCCGAELFETADPPAQIFARLFDVLQKDGFYELAAAQKLPAPQSGATFEIGVLRCGPATLVNSGAFSAPTRNAQTTVLRVAVPLGTTPRAALDSGLLRLVDDFTRTVYQSGWEGSDIY